MENNQAGNARESNAGSIFSWNSLLFAFIVGIIPNLFFLLVSPFYLAERLISPWLYIIAAFAMMFLPRIFGWIAFFLAAAIDLGLIIMIAFHLPINVALDSIRYMVSIDISASILYISISACVLVTTILAARLTFRYKNEFKASSPLPVVMFAAALMAYDWKYTLPYFAPLDSDFESARIKTNLSASKIASEQKNLLIVMVEGLGAFKNQKDRALFEDALKSGLPENRFKLESGRTVYKGSTTGAASRELCNQWGDYLTYLGTGPHNCLPRKLADAGFETISYHGFGQSMFKRNLWYPEIGFSEINFATDILNKHKNLVPSVCGSVFNGLCDLEVGDVVHQRLLEKSDKPKFIYWLTLNTHIPFVAKEKSEIGCGTKSAAIDNKTVCELTDMWLDVFKKVSKIASDPNLPNTDILIVGDHHTPLWERAAKDKFILNNVDYYLLRDQSVINVSEVRHAQPLSTH